MTTPPPAPDRHSHRRERRRKSVTEDDHHDGRHTYRYPFHEESNSWVGSRYVDADEPYGSSGGRASFHKVKMATRLSPEEVYAQSTGRPSPFQRERVKKVKRHSRPPALGDDSQTTADPMTSQSTLPGGNEEITNPNIIPSTSDAKALDVNDPVIMDAAPASPTESAAQPSTLPPVSYQELVQKISRLEQSLATINRTIKKDMEPPLVQDEERRSLGSISSDEDESSLDSDFDTMSMERRAIGEFARALRRSRRVRHDRANESPIYVRREQHRKEPYTEAESSVWSDSEAAAEQDDRDDKLLLARVRGMLANGTPAASVCVPWANFQSPDGFIVDSIVTPMVLLVGEPQVADSYERYRGGRMPTVRPLPSKNVIEVKGPRGGEHLERIIVYSSEILTLLSSLNTNRPPYASAPLSFLRPFRVFAYYQEAIRLRVKQLEERHAQTAWREPESEAAPVEVADSEKTAGKKASEVLALLHMRCLLEFLDTEICPKAHSLREQDCEKITFSDIWYLYQPEDEVIDLENEQVYRVLRVTMPKHRITSPYARYRLSKSSKEDFEDPPAVIQCVYIDFDGEMIGPVVKKFVIPRFNQQKATKSLPIYPLRMVKGPNYRGRLVQRGKKLWDVIQVRPMYYKGHTIDTREEVDSQVMIDFNEALTHARESDKDWKPKVDFISTATREGEPEVMVFCGASCCKGQRLTDDSYVDDNQTEDFVATLVEQTLSGRRSLILEPIALRDMLESKQTPLDDEYLLMSYRVYGFILRSRKWAQFDLAYLTYENRDRRKSTLSAFDRLVLPEGHKDMVQSLVTQHFRDKKIREKRANKEMDEDTKADLIRGKGQGLIILLHGSPGVGKTTTAEGVAELFHKPLFQVTCGDLATTAATVQIELEKIFTLASRWDCILLLDEAEVFLASRTRNDFIRNGLVAVFLRVLEYYTGILFLTTNRVGDFDEAFASRIHMSLHYPKLDLQKTEEVFHVNFDLIKAKFAQQNRELDIDEDAILLFARQHFEANTDNKNRGKQWNGRQIRNACQTVLAMAEFDALKKKLQDNGRDIDDLSVEPAQTVSLRIKHFKTIEKAYDDFATYLGAVYGKGMDERAAANQVRAIEGDELKGKPGKGKDHKQKDYD